MNCEFLVLVFWKNIKEKLKNFFGGFPARTSLFRLILVETTFFKF